MFVRRFYALAFLALATPVVHAWFGRGKKDKDDVCRLYLSPSSLGELGIFSGMDLEPGDLLDALDIVVPLSHDATDWSSSPWAHTYAIVESEGRMVLATLPGVGSAANRHVTLHNVSPLPSQADTAGLHRSRDAGVGAFAYEVMKWNVTSRIAAGGEILTSDKELLHPVLDITEADYAEADRVLNMVNAVFAEVGGRKFVEVRQDLLKWIRSAMTRPVSDVFPASLEQLDRAVQMGSVRAWLAQDLQLSISSLREKGVCLDNISPAVSTLPQAGRGGFAARPLKQGSIVAPVPVHHLSRTDFEMHDGGPPQLLLNYCVGHPHSSLVLCPYAGALPIVNHAPRKSANVQLEWSSTIASHHTKWSNLSVSEVLGHMSAGLALQLVATRDIEAGEEILLDYGEPWELAWLDHLQNWEVPPEAEAYQSAAESNQLNLDQIRTHAEQEKDPYPNDVLVGCHVDYDSDSSVAAETHIDEDGFRVRNIQWTNTEIKRNTEVRPCTILERTSAGGSDVYTAILHNHPSLEEGSPSFIKSDELVKVTGIPRNGLRFVDQSYSTDMYLPGAFRHEIQVPDGIYPEAWLDILPEIGEEAEVNPEF